MDESGALDRSRLRKSSMNSDPIEDSGYSSNVSEISDSFRHPSPAHLCTPVFHPISASTLDSNEFKAYQDTFLPSKRLRLDSSSSLQDSPYLNSGFTIAGKRGSTNEEPERTRANSVGKNSLKEAPGSAEPTFYVSTPYSNFSDYIDKLKLTPSPAARTTLNGRAHVDFLYFLGVKGVHNPALQIIFSYLSDHDLYNASRVSKTWRQVITSDDVSKRRITNFLYRPMKENVAPLLSDPKLCEDEELPGTLMRRVQLMEIQNKGVSTLNVQNQNKETVTNKSPPVSPSKVRFHLFQKEAQKLDPGEQLVQCPRCSLPSRQDKAKNLGSCTRQGCQYQFCLNCYREFHQPHSCSLLTPRYSKNSLTINSKASRKFLRRL